MRIPTDKKYAIVCPTSIGVRITPEGNAPVHTSDHFMMQCTSAETNVVNVFTSLGQKGLALTKFVEGSPIALFIQRKLRERGIDYEGKTVPQGGPWGYRHQFNIADSGSGLRAPRVWNDRAGEVGATLCSSDFDLERIFGKEGAAIVHVSGLIAAMSEQTTGACLDIVRFARQRGSLISFDLNYRATFWKGREEELRAAFCEIASLSDILVGNEEDFQLCLGLKGPETGGKNLESKLSGYQAMIGEAKKAYPDVQVFGTTLREVVTAREHLWGAILFAEDGWHVEAPRRIPVLDRIGGGDGFTGGLLYGLYRGFAPERCLAFGWATGAMVAGSLMDYAEPADEKQVWDVYQGNARVQR